MECNTIELTIAPTVLVIRAISFATAEDFNLQFTSKSLLQISKLNDI